MKAVRNILKYYARYKQAGYTEPLLLQKRGAKCKIRRILSEIEQDITKDRKNNK